jgi:HEAT repeat protein
VFAVPSLVGHEPPPDHPGVQALLHRLDDLDPGVRDWAAFGLGLARVDTPRVRRVLHRLVERPDEEAAGEAAVALARLGDRSVLPHLLRQLAGVTVGNLWVEAAAELAALEALPLLEPLQAAKWAENENEPRPHLLADALLACRTARPRSIRSGPTRGRCRSPRSADDGGSRRHPQS